MPIIIVPAFVVWSAVSMSVLFRASPTCTLAQFARSLSVRRVGSRTNAWIVGLVARFAADRIRCTPNCPDAPIISTVGGGVDIYFFGRTV